MNLQSAASTANASWTGALKFSEDLNLDDGFDVEIPASDVVGTLPDYVIEGTTCFASGDPRGPTAHSLFDRQGFNVGLRHKIDGTAQYIGQPVITDSFIKEKSTGQIEFPGYGVTPHGEGLWGRFKAWGKRIFAALRLPNRGNTAFTDFLQECGRRVGAILNEAAVPVLFDLKTLKTIGESYLGILRKLRQDLYSAHPHRDAQSGVTYNIGSSAKMAMPHLSLYATSPQGVTQKVSDVKLRGFTLIHDFALSGQWAIVPETPWLGQPLKVIAWILGWEILFRKIFAWEADKGNRIHMLHRTDPSQNFYIATEASAIFHLISAHEMVGNPHQTVVYAVEHESAQDMYDDVERVIPGEVFQGRGGHVTRTIINTVTKNVLEKSVIAPVTDQGSYEFPIKNPNFEGRPHRYSYMNEFANDPDFGRGYLGPRIGKLDLQKNEWSWIKFENGIAHAPEFIPDPNGQDEEDGVLVSYVYHPERCFVVYIDPKTMTEMSRTYVPAMNSPFHAKHFDKD